MRLFCAALLLMIGIISCNSPIARAPTQTPIPFLAIHELPQGEFLFVFIDDDDHRCLDDLCLCPVSEPPAPPFEFRDGKLVLNEHFFDEEPSDWTSLRKSRNAIVLYGDSSQWVAQLQTFSSFPIIAPVGGFTILGVNAEGDIRVTRAGQFEIIPHGSYINATSPEQVSDECKVLHVYRLNNYGFIKDENVEFFE